MSAEFLHVGVPVTTKKPGMTYIDAMKIWVSNPADCDFKIEYLKFEEGTPFPEIMHKNPHVAYRVDAMTPYLAEAQQVIFGPAKSSSGSKMAFILKDDTIFELME